MDEAMYQFLVDEIFTLVLQGTLQRSPTYEEKVSERRKADFKQALRDDLERMALEYENPVLEETHVSNIDTLARDLSNRFRDCLLQGRFRIGSAQKALNLYLKYIWCLGKIPPPPHCPFDSIIIQRLGCHMSWTELDRIEEYQTLVERAKQAADGRPLAEWELFEYNNA